MPGKRAWESSFRGSVWPAELLHPSSPPQLQPQPAATRTTIHGLRTHRPPPQEILLQLNTTAVVAGVLSVDKNGAAIPFNWGPKTGPKKLPKLDLLVGRKRGGLFIVLHAWVPNYDSKMSPKLDSKNGFKTASATTTANSMALKS